MSMTVHKIHDQCITCYFSFSKLEEKKKKKILVKLISSTKIIRTIRAFRITSGEFLGIFESSTMGKKRTVKQQDFQKKKLKVGKPKQQASNVTDTSFQVRKISLPQQTRISSGSGDLNDEIVKRVSLLRHHSEVTRKETLIYYQSMISRIIHMKCMRNVMNGAIPMICDSSKSVREELLKLLDIIGEHDSNVLKLQIRPLTLFINNAMTHIIAPIQRDSGKFCQIIMKHCGDELVRHSWVKILKGFFQVLGWSVTNSSDNGKKTLSLGINSSNVVSINKNKKYKNENLQSLLQFIKLGCLPQQSDTDSASLQNSLSPIYSPYLIPEFPQPFAYLKLFTREFTKTDSTQFSMQELDALSCEDQDTRKAIFEQHFQRSIQLQLPALIKEGGDCGRTAHTLGNLLSTITLSYGTEHT